MTSLEKFAEAKILEYKDKNLVRSLSPTISTNGLYIERNGKKLLSFASNDYLGLKNHPELIQAAIEATKEYGAGAGASRYISGNHPLYEILEKKIAEFNEFEEAIVLGSGYLANIGAIPALAGKEDLIIVDKLSHACIIDGAKLSGADFLRFKHNDCVSLAKILEMERGKYKKCLIVTETIFSMDGDRAPLDQISTLAEKYDCWVLADSAHSLYGKANYPKNNFLLMGTFSKSLGSYGGYIAGSKKIIEYLKNSMRSAIFTTALPPAIIAASIAALDIVTKNPGLAIKSLNNARSFTEIMQLKRAESAIVPYIVDSPEMALQLAAGLEDKGFLSVAIRPPTVKESRLRFSFSSLHIEQQVKDLATAVKGIAI